MPSDSFDQPKNPMKSTISGIIRVYNREAPAVLLTPRGRSPEGLVPMNPHDTADECIRIHLHSEKHPGLFALIDPEDFDLVNQYRWHPIVRPWATYAGTGRKSRKMHRVILDAPSGMVVDHINGDGLDNRRINLRLCSNLQNSHNLHSGSLRPIGTSKYIGVYFRLRNGRDTWCAKVTHEFKNIHLGQFDDEVAAALARDEFVRNSEFASFSRFNFPKAGELAYFPEEIDDAA